MQEKGKGLFHQALPALAAEPLHLLESHGRFLPNNEFHANALISLWNGMESHFRKVPRVVRGGKPYLYYDPQDLSKRISPDIIVLLDYDMGGRETYRFWVERKAPDFALDVIAPESRIRAPADQTELFAALGIKEYFRFQPNPEREEPRVVGYRLWGQEYIELGHDPSAGPEGAVRSETLGVSLRPDGERVRLRYLATGEDYSWFSEKDALIAAGEREAAVAEEKARHAARERRAADQRLAAAEKRLRMAEARLAKVEALLATAGAQLSADL